jgi:hypothetical protein
VGSLDLRPLLANPAARNDPLMGLQEQLHCVKSIQQGTEGQHLTESFTENPQGICLLYSLL